MNTVKLFHVLASTIILTACSGDSTESLLFNPDATMEVIASGANLAGANGLGIGPDGLLYVASVLGSNITVLNPDTGEIVEIFDADDGVVGPDDLAFGADGSWYWTSIMTGEVAGFSATGERIVAAQLTPGVNPITFSDDGRLFVSQCFFGTNLYEIDPAGVRPARLMSDELGPGCGLNGMDWGPDGRLYGPRWFNHEIVSFNVNDNSMRTEVSGLNTPAAVKFDQLGRLHVLDTGIGAVLRVDADELVEVAKFTPGLDNIVFDQQGRLFVSSFTDGFIKRVNLDGSVTELQPGGMAHSGGLTFHKGDIVSADLHAIRGYRTNGEESFVQRNVLGVGKMGGALNLASDGEKLILTSWIDGDVRIWDQETQTRTWEKTGLLGPVAAVRYAGLIVVSEHGKQRVIGFSVDDENAETVIAENLPAPTGLTTSGGDLYVTDRVLGQVLRLAHDGEFLNPPELVIENLTTPEGITIISDGFVVIEADKGEVTLIRADGSRRMLGKILAGSQAASSLQPPSQVFNGITKDDEGNLYVVGEIERELYKILRD